MIVEELIQFLRGCPQNAEVLFSDFETVVGGTISRGSSGYLKVQKEDYTITQDGKRVYLETKSLDDIIEECEGIEDKVYGRIFIDLSDPLLHQYISRVCQRVLQSRKSNERHLINDYLTLLIQGGYISDFKGTWTLKKDNTGWSMPVPNSIRSCLIEKNILEKTEKTRNSAIWRLKIIRLENI